MPFPRPVSPVTFETCAPPPDNDIDSGTLLGSDDELDDIERAAKRQRIERLAESYLQGQPLFILSASLRGPFDQGWRNPWKKTRTRNNAVPNRGSACASTSNTERVVRGTDPRHAKYREEIPPSSRKVDGSPLKKSVHRAIPASDSEPGSALDVGPAEERPIPVGSQHDSSRALTRSPRKQRKESTCSENDPTFAGNGAVDWLKKDRRRMNFKVFEPPTSPTPRGSRPPSQHKPPVISSRIGKPQIPSAPSRVRSPNNPLVSRQPSLEGAMPRSPQPPESSTQAAQKTSSVARDPPQRISPRRGEHENSFKIVSSSSQLPRFEYRRPRHEFSPLRQSKSPAKEAVEEAAPDVSVDDQHVDSDEHEVDDIEERGEDQPAEDPAQSLHLSKSLRFAKDPDGNDPTSTCLQTTTEQNTCENLPSAQEVPAPPGVSDRVPSLHSTAMPKDQHDQGISTSPETQLSTQAALLHAQRSFQDDLETQEHAEGTPGQQRPEMNAGNDSLLAHETPLFRPDTLERAPRSFKQFDKDRVQAMSTQCMIDAATPYTFSTGKKPRAFRSVPMEETNPQKPDDVHMAEVSSPESSSPLPTNNYHTAQSSPTSPAHEPDCVPIHQSTTHATPLPFALSGSTPAAAQDGQGGADSFNLSQAIADAGSWLRESFDFMKDLRHTSPHRTAVPSDASSAMDLDTPR